ncbi:MBL fold metallo-hydrolase [Thermatribacter velox]|uniref:MBL fold metallo-hydrolase n=1 Tax=Thermatribacter velox TaxID=3039681 RepID=A0ABZ2YA49_9BACT
MEKKEERGAVKVTILYDNFPFLSELLPSHGFSCLVEGEEKVLFDTGESGPLLFKNMELLGIDPLSISRVVISHEHYDHIGGLGYLLARNPKVVVYILPSFSQDAKREIKERGARFLEVERGMEIAPSVFTTGEVEGPVREQALVVKGEQGFLLIGGCCHPGAVKMVEAAALIGNGKIELLIGGLHLYQSSDEEIMQTLQGLRQLGVSKIAPSHCSGFAALDYAQKLWGENYIASGVGKSFNF